MNEPPLKIIYITGWLRSGSTVLGNILNEVPGFFHVGELHFLWKNAAGRGVNRLCGCGRTLTECPLWSAILPLCQPSGVSAHAYADTVVHRQRACIRTRHTWRVLRRGLWSDEISAHAALMTRTYHAIAERTGARVIVDSGKIPGEAALLPHLEAVTPYYVHLVRDPRAVAQSYRQPKHYVYPMSSVRSTAYWHGFNLASEALTRHYPSRSVFLRYEEFLADPAGTIDALLRLCGADVAANPMRNRMIELHVNHTVTGNPDRLRAGATLIRDSDDSWKADLPRPARLAAETLSWPRLWRYGYRRGGTLPGRPVPAATSAAQATDKP